MANAKTQSPDQFTKAQKIADGSFPRIAVDYKKKEVHLIYSSSNGLVYQKGDLNGKFGAKETAYQGRVYDPRITLDKEGSPHIVIATSGSPQAKTYYTNRVGGKWKNKLLALEKCDHMELTNKWRATTPSVTVDNDGHAFVSAFIGCVCRIENTDTQPKVVHTWKAISKRERTWGHIPVFAWNDELWMHKGSPMGLRK